VSSRLSTFAASCRKGVPASARPRRSAEQAVRMSGQDVLTSDAQHTAVSKERLEASNRLLTVGQGYSRTGGR
jgi:hypothetical protein